MSAQVHGFQTEVAKLLDLLANSLYSNKEVFLRELVSNASDAIDKLRFLSISDQTLLGDDPELCIRVRADKENRTLTISDNGIGMTLEEANTNLGTIAKSGTGDFFSNLTGDQAKDSQLIGQFGVGFYSAFIVADRVTVYSRSAKSEQGVRWESSGTGTFESEEIERKERGTTIVLHLKESEVEWLDSWKLEEVIVKYSNHVVTPVLLWREDYEAKVESADGKDAGPVFAYKQVNNAKALWANNPRDLKDEDYKEFYKNLTHAYDEPMTWAHNRVEGDMEYTSLLYVPKDVAWDLYDYSNRKGGLKLFVQRVFIMDEAEQFLPRYLRFIKGLVDTNDLPLNVSREILQDSSVTRKLKKALTKRALTMLEKLAQDKEKYQEFWNKFGRAFKEAPIEDPAGVSSVQKLMRFASTKGEGSTQCVSLAEYVERMPKGQDKIYYLNSNSWQNAVNSPYLETFRKKDVEVLLMWDPVDEFMMDGMREFEGRKFVSAMADNLELGELADKQEEEEKKEIAKQSEQLVERIKKSLEGKVQEVRVSSRLVDSPSCVVGLNDMMISNQMRRMLAAAGQGDLPEDQLVLEINPKHALMQKIEAETDEARFGKWCEFILNQALLAEKGSLKDPNGFMRLVNELLTV